MDMLMMRVMVSLSWWGKCVSLQIIGAGGVLGGAVCDVLFGISRVEGPPFVEAVGCPDDFQGIEGWWVHGSAFNRWDVCAVLPTAVRVCVAWLSCGDFLSEMNP